jgi:23S rRNA pseudouridine955/2504/2580 synthase
VIQLVCDKAQTLKQFTENNCAQASFVFPYLLKNKEIKINGKKTGADMPLQAGDIVCYYLTQKQAEKAAFHTVYQDENVWIVDKESGVNSEAVFAELSRKTGGRCAFIHRLDRNTRGLLAFALTEMAERELLAAFKEKRVEKIYHALCFGRFKKSTDTLIAYLKKDGEKSKVWVYDAPKAGAEKIVTAYSVLETREDCTKAEIVLHTGKTHQIRAHLSHIGCPIVGDMKYGDAEKNREKNVSRQMLVAKYLSFQCTGELSYLNGKIFTSRFDV